MVAGDLVAQEELEGLAGALEAGAGFVFGEQALVDGSLAGFIDQVGNAGEAGVDRGQLEVVVDLVEQVAKGGGVAVAGAEEAAEVWWELLLYRFFEDGAAHDGAGRVEAEEVTAGGLVEVAVGFFRAGSGNDAFAQMGGALYGRLDEFEEFDGEGGAEKVVLLGVEGTLDLLPLGGRAGGGLEASERGQALSGMVDKALMHFGGKHTPASNESRGSLPIAGPKFVIDDGGKCFAKLAEAAGAGELGDGPAEFAAWGVFGGHLHELVFEALDVDGHCGGVPFPVSSLGVTGMVEGSRLGIIAVRVQEWEGAGLKVAVGNGCAWGF